MHSVTTDRGQESRRSHLNGPTLSIRVPAAEGRQDISAGLTVQCGIDRGTGEGGRARREDTEQREEAHHDIFCFPTQMAISSAVRALLSSVQVGEEELAGELDWMGCDARMPEVSYQRPSRRFIMMIIRLGSGACEFLAAD